MREQKKNNKPVIWFFILLMAFTQSSCYNLNFYKLSDADYSSNEKLSATGTWPYNQVFAHVGDKVYQLTNVSYSPSTEQITATIIRKEKDAYAIYQKVKKDGSLTSAKELNKDKLHQIHFFISEIYQDENNFIKINKADIIKTQLIKKAKGASAAAKGGVVLVTVAAGLGLFLLIVCGCPHVYAVNDGNYVKASNTIVGALTKKLEKNDFVFVESNQSNSLDIKLVNEDINETQFINHSKLIQVIHDKGTQVVPGADNRIHQVSSLISPIDEELESILIKNDAHFYDFQRIDKSTDLSELKMTFPVSKKAKHLKLFLSVRNTEWSSHVIKEWYKLFGSDISKHQEKMEKQDRQKLLDWRKEQGISMSVYVKSNGAWQYQCNVDVVGTGIYKDIVVPITKPKESDEQIEVKLVSGYKLWDIDFAGIDQSSFENFSQNEFVPRSVSESDNQNYSSLIDMDDNYHTLKEGDTLSLHYDLNPIPSGKIQTTILNVSGYYKTTIKQGGTIQKKSLLSFKQKAQMSRFSFKLMQELTQNSINI